MSGESDECHTYQAVNLEELRRDTVALYNTRKAVWGQESHWIELPSDQVNALMDCMAETVNRAMQALWEDVMTVIGKPLLRRDQL